MKRLFTAAVVLVCATVWVGVWTPAVALAQGGPGDIDWEDTGGWTGEFPQTEDNAVFDYVIEGEITPDFAWTVHSLLVNPGDVVSLVGLAADDTNEVAATTLHLVPGGWNEDEPPLVTASGASTSLTYVCPPDMPPDTLITAVLAIEDVTGGQWQLAARVRSIDLSDPALYAGGQMGEFMRPEINPFPDIDGTAYEFRGTMTDDFDLILTHSLRADPGQNITIELDLLDLTETPFALLVLVPGGYTEDDDEVVLGMAFVVSDSAALTYPIPANAPPDALYTVALGGMFSNPAQAYWLKAIVW